MGKAEPLAAARAKLERLAADGVKVTARVEELREAIAASGAAVDEAGAAAAVDPGPVALAALAEARAAREVAIRDLDSAEEQLGFIKSAASRLEREIAESEDGAARARLEAARSALRESIRKALPAFRAMAEDVLTLDALERRPDPPSSGRITGRDLRFRAEEIAAAPGIVANTLSAHTPWAELIDAGKARALAIRADKKEV